jgi:hypothetical protein
LKPRGSAVLSGTINHPNIKARNMTRWLTRAMPLAILLLSTQASAQSSWDSHGAWRAVMQQAQAGPLCMLEGLGQTPHSFGVLVTSGKDLLLFALDDRTPGLAFRPDMTVLVDGQEVAAFSTFNDPPMTSTERSDAPNVRRLIQRISIGKTMVIQARGLEYQIDLTGFAAAAQDLKQCESQNGL